jgi:hypothetical protein
MESFVARRAMLLYLCLSILMIQLGKAHAAEPVGRDAAPPDVSKAELGEIEVIGKKQLRREVEEAQDRFYALYDRLNKKKEFNIHCVDEKRTGTLVPSRVCRVAFLQLASSDQSREFLLGLTRGESRRYLDTPEIEWQARREEYIENARALLLASPELRTLAVKWQELQRQYDRPRNAQVGPLK